MNKLLIKIIKMYQKYISPMYPRRCRFQPTCSEYFIEALIKYGVIKGSILGAWRIIKCNPFVRGGYDPLK